MGEQTSERSNNNNPGRGRGRDNNRRNNKGGRSYKRNFNKYSHKPVTSKLKNGNEQLSGCIFDYGSHSHRDLFNKSIKQLITFVGQNFPNPGDILPCLEQLKEITPTEPEPPAGYNDGNATKAQILIFETAVKRHLLKLEQFKENLVKLFSTIWGQCTENLKAKLESLTNWLDIKEKKKAIQLLIEIKNIIFMFEDQSYEMHSLFKANESVYLMKQKEDESITKYYERFMDAVETAEQYGACFGIDKATMEKDEKFTELTDDEKGEEENIIAAQQRSRDRYLAYIFIYRLDHVRYGTMKRDLQNDYAKGAKTYPQSIVEAYNLALNYRSDKKKTPNNNKTTGLSFNQNKANNKNKDITCYKCGKKGHYASNCRSSNNNARNDTTNSNVGTNNNTEQPNNNEDNNNQSNNNNTETTNTTQERNNLNSNRGRNQRNNMNFLQISHENIEEATFNIIEDKTKTDTYDIQLMNENDIEELKNLLLLDNQSTTDLWCNKEHLHNIRKVNGTCTVVTNGGQLTTNLKGYLPNYGMVWYHEAAITNILSLSNVKKKFKITYDSSEDNCFKVHIKNKVLKFTELKNGLYAIKLKTIQAIFINTVQENMMKYSRRQIDRANKAKELYAIVGYPSIADFKNMIKFGLITNCPVTLEDINIATDIYGPDIAALKGKTVHKKPLPERADFIKVPRELMKIHKHVQLVADVLFVNKMPMVLTISINIDFTTIEPISSRNIKLLAKAFDHVTEYYGKRGFIIDIIHTDPEFQKVEEHMEYKGPRINPSSAKEHQPIAERRVRVIKERSRARRSQYPYQLIPRMIIVNTITDIVGWINAFYKKMGLQGMSPRMFMTGEKFDYNKHCRIEVGAYAQVHEEPHPLNSMQPRTIGAIALGPARNLQGGYRFMNLNTGKVIIRRNFTKLPMPDDVIRRIEQMARKEDSDFVFQDRHGNLLFEEPDDPKPIYQPTDDNDEEYDIDSYLHPEQDAHDEATGVEDDKIENEDTDDQDNSIIPQDDESQSEDEEDLDEDQSIKQNEETDEEQNEETDEEHPKITGVPDTSVTNNIDDEIPDLTP
jgi:hypothetical protein